MSEVYKGFVHKGFGGHKSTCKKCGKVFAMKRQLKKHKQEEHAV